MMKNYAFITILALFLSATYSHDLEAAKIRNNAKTSISKSSKKNKKKSYKKRRFKRYKRNANGPDLKELTTNSPYTENPDNGVNEFEVLEGNINR